MAGRYGALDRNYNKRKPKFAFTELTLGQVVDTNDPQQMGRIRANCPQLGDTATKPLGEIPWASYVSPLGGVDQLSTRGRESADGNATAGTVAYGMWNIPNVGTTVLIGCVDGDTKFRVWLGCLHGQYATHTMPHGRYVDGVDGPVSSEETPIQPLADGLATAFNNQFDSPEYASRARDTQVSGIDGEIISSVESNLSAKADTGGYTQSRFDPTLPSATTGGVNKDSQVYSWTTPGFHGFSMDDNVDNCRIRFRTTHGTQIIFDDTNERIYVQTSEGKTLFEMDEKGAIDIFASETVSVRSRGDINLTADKTIRMSAKDGIHLATNVFRVNSTTTDIKTSGAVVIESTGSTLTLKAEQDIDINSGAKIINSAGNLFEITATGFVAQVAPGNFDWVASTSTMTSGNLFCANFATASISASTIEAHTHPYTWTDPGGSSDTSPGSYGGSSAGSAPGVSPSPGTAQSAYFSNRVPDHEPWARMYLDLGQTDNDGTTLTYPSDGNFLPLSEYSATDELVGKGSQQRDITFERNDNWRR